MNGTRASAQGLRVSHTHTHTGTHLCANTHTQLAGTTTHFHCQHTHVQAPRNAVQAVPRVHSRHTITPSDSQGAESIHTERPAGMECPQTVPTEGARPTHIKQSNVRTAVSRRPLQPMWVQRSAGTLWEKWNTHHMPCVASHPCLSTQLCTTRQSPALQGTRLDKCKGGTHARRLSCNTGRHTMQHGSHPTAGLP